MLFLNGFSSSNLSICRDVIKSPAGLNNPIKAVIVAPVDLYIDDISLKHYKAKYMIEKNLYVFEHFKSRLYWANGSYHYPINLMEEKQFCQQFFPDDYIGSAVDQTSCMVYCLSGNNLWLIDLE